MAATFTANATFKAIDKISRPMRAMTKASGNFAQRTEIAFARVQRAGRKVNKTIGRMFGVIGKLGLGFGALMIIQQIATATIELDANLQSLQAITGVTGDAFNSFAKEIDKVSEKQKIFAGDTAKAFEIIGSAKPELLANAKSLSKVTDAAITLKKAGLMPIEDSAKALTGTLNQFGLRADQSQRVINVLAAGAKEGSANIKLLSESYDKVGAVAASANMSVEQTGAALELMSKFELKGSEAGISLKSTLLRLKAAGLGFSSGQFKLNDALSDFNKKMNAINDPIKKAAYEEKIFGKVHILTGKILSENVDEINRLTKAMTGTNEATKQAEINSNTLKNRFGEMVSVIKNHTTTTDQNNKALNKIKDAMKFVAENMDKIISATINIIKVFLFYKAVMLVTGAALAIYNIALGLSGALSATASIAIGKNAIALGAYAIASKVATVAAWLFSAALWANPITWIVIGIIALVAAIVLLIVKWKEITEWVKTSDSGFAKFIRASLFPILLLFKAIGFVIGFIIDKFKQLINWVKTSDSGFAKFLKGALQQHIEAFEILGGVLEKVGGFFGKIWDWIKKIGGAALKPIIGLIDAFNKGTQSALGVDVDNTQPPLQTTNEVAAQESIKREERIVNQKAELNINNKTDFEMSIDAVSSFPIKMDITN